MGRRILLAILALFSAGTTALAQSTGRIVGRVTANEGRSLPGIQITVSGTTRNAILLIPLADSRSPKFPPEPFVTRSRHRVWRGHSTVTVAGGQAVTVSFTLTSVPRSSIRSSRSATALQDRAP